MSTDEEVDFSTLDWCRLSVAQKVELQPAIIRRAHRMRSAMAWMLLSAVAGAVRRAAKSLTAAIRRVNEIYGQRVAIAKLHGLDDAALRDIGIRRAEIESIIQGQGKDDTRRQRVPDAPLKKGSHCSLAA